MTVLMRVMPQQETDAGFSLLKDIIALVKNPDQIEEAHKRALETAALTEEELAKLAQARAFMANANAMKQEIEDAQSTLTQHQQEHAGNVERANAEHIRKHNQLQLLSAELEAKAEAQAATDLRHAQERSSLDEGKAALQGVHDEAMAKVRERESAVGEGERANVDEAERLTEYKSRLDERAKKMMMAATEE